MKRRKNTVSTTQKWLLLAGLTAGAYWLYTKSKTPSPTGASPNSPSSTNITSSVPDNVAV